MLPLFRMFFFIVRIAKKSFAVKNAPGREIVYKIIAGDSENQSHLRWQILWITKKPSNVVNIFFAGDFRSVQYKKLLC